jgi:methylenetetrahydrofolate reductase (NADPH)
VFRAVSYGLKSEDGLIDYDQLEAVALAEKPQLIIAGFSAYSRHLDFARFRRVADQPGILPVENFEKMLNFAGRCQARVPEWMHTAFSRAETAEERYLLSVSIACDQMDGLMGEGVEHLHVYTLNNPDLTFDVCRVLGYAAAPLAAAGEAGAA